MAHLRGHALNIQLFGVVVSVQEDPVVAATALFTEVIGIGPAFAAKLVHEYGCRTFEDVKAKDVPLNHQQTLVCGGGIGAAGH